MLNRIWAGLIFISLLWGIGASLLGEPQTADALVASLFEMAALATQICLGLIGVMCFWLGLMEIANVSGLSAKLAAGLAPLFSRLMPEVPRGDKAISSISMNMAANMLGLDNAATPAGIQAMRDLQVHNQTPAILSNAQILFLVINTSSVTLIPTTVFVYRAQLGAAAPTDVFLPILLATSCSTLVGLLTVAWIQKLKILSPVVLAYFIGAALLLGGLLAASVADGEIGKQSAVVGNLTLLMLIAGLFAYGFFRRVKMYDAFITGAKNGFDIAISIIPYLVAMLFALGLLRASGVLELLLEQVRVLVAFFGGDTRFVDALPTAIMKPFSGSGSRALMIETMETYGADSFAGRLAAVYQGSTETTFYVLAVYCGAVAITRTRYALLCALIADGAGMFAATLLGYWFFA
ncbi:nucleoside recognition domain-containing protein [Gilvimarinus chinensis]|uniref:nucleoside recognition domain-containing protein n=1 Tax=Gilvimarinus chinensis TaxID=396005 RepID=UPI000374A020|nr:nucleoside recognition domain-containing protein [Gilvimarinus chinensis]